MLYPAGKRDYPHRSHGSDIPETLKCRIGAKHALVSAVIVETGGPHPARFQVLIVQVL